MIYPYKLTASPEEVTLWATTFFPFADHDASAWGEGAFPVLSADPDSGVVQITPMLSVNRLYDFHAEYFISAALLTPNSTIWRAFCRRRCLVPVSALRVQRKGLRGVQNLFEFSPTSQSLFALAGVWDSFVTAEGHSLKAFRAITVHPNTLFSNVFPELPVIVLQGDYSRWLAMEQDGSLPIDVLRPLSALEMKRWVMLPADNAEGRGEAEAC